MKNYFYSREKGVISHTTNRANTRTRNIIPTLLGVYWIKLLFNSYQTPIYPLSG